MIQLTGQTRILVAVEPVDFRKGIDSLCRLCKTKMRSDPFDGTMFVFCNRRRTAIKILTYDGQGFWHCQKRLSEKKFHWWPQKGEDSIAQLAAHELQFLIWNSNPAKAQVPIWRNVTPMSHSDNENARSHQVCC